MGIDEGLDIGVMDGIVDEMPEVEKKPVQKVQQEQIHTLLFGDQLSWQSIIYDLINSEQLNPWDIDLSLLSQKFLEKVRLLEEANFFVSSKVLFAAALLLRIKSEILLETDIQSLDDILFGKKEEKKYIQERIELDEEIPNLIIRTPLPRFKKVTLDELMSALGNAIKTETRRIQKVALTRQQEFETALSLPKKRININESIKGVHAHLEDVFKNRTERVAFSEIAGTDDNEKRVATFVPLLHLDNQHKVWLEQDKHFDEIWILLKEMYEEKNAEALEKMRKEVDEAMKDFEKEDSDKRKAAEDFNEDFGNPIASAFEKESNVKEERDEEEN
ncbi:MAG: segregation/condensation protein A [Nanoarchaeota archaeon]